MKQPRVLHESPSQITPDDYMGRMRVNLNELVRLYEERGEKRSDIATHCGLSGHQQLTNMLNGKHPKTQVDNVIKVSVHLGVPPGRLFQSAEEFRVSLVTDPPVPFAPASRLRSIDSLHSSEDSGVVAAKTRSHFPNKKSAAAAKTSRSGVSIRCLTHSRDDQRGLVRASGEVYEQRAERAHPLWPARTGVRVPETLIPSTLAA